MSTPNNTVTIVTGKDKVELPTDFTEVKINMDWNHSKEVQQDMADFYDKDCIERIEKEANLIKMDNCIKALKK